MRDWADGGWADEAWLVDVLRKAKAEQEKEKRQDAAQKAKEAEALLVQLDAANVEG